ncbi:YciI family protein [Xanthomonas arboricola]|uniref:YciI family protein n=1 Tax=Xanthomonas arboricola TaxID=56448 RepID=UPI001427D776|nr:YciI family protein [Xanthomonas arboricola]
MSTEELMARMLRKQYYIVESAPSAHLDAIREQLREHLLYLIGLEQAGAVLASGPFGEGPHHAPGSGLTILRGDSAEHAYALAQEDPLVQRGLRQIKVTPWTINEGTVTVKVSFSNGAAAFN